MKNVIFLSARRVVLRLYRVHALSGLKEQENCLENQLGELWNPSANGFCAKTHIGDWEATFTR